MEEDIKILEFLKDSEIWFPLQNVKKPMFSERQKQALENLLTRYKQLEEENGRLINSLNISIEQNRENNKHSIPKSKVKEKIEELQREFDFYAGREHFEWQDGEFDGEQCDDIALKIGALKELLREE